MQYKLDEEQSKVFMRNMYLIDSYSEKISTEAVSIVNYWYNTYTSNCKWFWIERSMKSFLRSIAKLDGLELYEGTMGYQYISFREGSGWVTGMKVDKIVELTGLKLRDVVLDADKVWRAALFEYQNSSFIRKNFNIYNDVKHYCKPPYTLDDKLLNHMKNCELFISENNIKE